MQENIAFLATDVGRLFRKRYDIVSRDLGITGAQWRVLAAVNRTPGINQCALASWLEVEAITVGRMIDRLVKLGMVERRPDPADRRAWMIFLTPAADPLIVQLHEFGRNVFDAALAGLSEAEHSQLLSLLQRVRANLIDESTGKAKNSDG